MTTRVAVTKMHGARNDFVILDRRALDDVDLPSFARFACDRHTGIGADGVLAIEASAIADVRMRVINADGGEAEMCGNGIRCVARYLGDERLRIETAAGIIETTIVAREPDFLVRVDMGVPRLESVTFASADTHFVNMGNPHVVMFVGALDQIDLVETGSRFQGDTRFAGGTNVHSVIVEGAHALRVRHYERGVGLTMACGTGAVASAVAAIRAGYAFSPVDVHVPGGTLTIEWDGSAHAYMTGPAVHVFEAELDVEDIYATR